VNALNAFKLVPPEEDQSSFVTWDSPIGLPLTCLCGNLALSQSKVHTGNSLTGNVYLKKK